MALSVRERRQEHDAMLSRAQRKWEKRLREEWQSRQVPKAQKSLQEQAAAQEQFLLNLTLFQIKARGQWKRVQYYT